MKEKKGGTCSTHGADKCVQKFNLEAVRDIDIDGRILLKWILNTFLEYGHDSTSLR
jgi:hypothetical protein